MTPPLASLRVLASEFARGTSRGLASAFGGAFQRALGATQSTTFAFALLASRVTLSTTFGTSCFAFATSLHASSFALSTSLTFLFTSLLLLLTTLHLASVFLLTMLLHAGSTFSTLGDDARADSEQTAVAVGGGCGALQLGLELGGA